jgi:hypothetical protein
MAANDVAGYDFSTNYITYIDPNAAAQVVASGIGHICMGYDSSATSASVRRTLMDAGLPSWSAYRFLYTWLDPASQVNDCVAGIHASNILPVYFVLDIEDYPTGNWPTIGQLEAAMDAALAAQIAPGQLVLPAIYTRSDFSLIYPGYTGPADRGWGLWSAYWTTVGNIDTVPIYSGWQRSQVIGHQWSGNYSSPIGTVDNDVFRLPGLAPTPPSPTPGQPDIPDAQAELNLLDQEIDQYAANLHYRVQQVREDLNT